MKKSIYSDEFDYKKVSYIIECDSSYSNEEDNYIIAWSIIDISTNITVLEGRKKSESKNSSDSEIEAVLKSIKEVIKMTKFNSNNGNPNVLIKTDFSGVYNAINNKQDFRKSLENLSSWGIEKVPRDQLLRPHKLANYKL